VCDGIDYRCRLIAADMNFEDDEETTKSSLLASAINLSNTILGAGVLAMPYVCTQLGIAFFAVNNRHPPSRLSYFLTTTSGVWLLG